MENNIQIINETEAVEIVKQPDLEIPLSIEKLESEIQGINESIGNNNESKIMQDYHLTGLKINGINT